MSKLFDIVLIVALILVSLFTLKMLFAKAPDPVAPERNMRYEATLECQKLFASTQREDFSYKSCIEELNKTLNKPKILEEIKEL